MYIRVQAGTYRRSKDGEHEFAGAECTQHARDELVVATCRHVGLERHVRARRLRGDVDRHVATLITQTLIITKCYKKQFQVILSLKLSTLNRKDNNASVIHP